MSIHPPPLPQAGHRPGCVVYEDGIDVNTLVVRHAESGARVQFGTKGPTQNALMRNSEESTTYFLTDGLTATANASV